MTFLLTLFLIVVGWLFVKSLITIYRIRRATKRFFHQFDGSDTDPSRPRERKGGWSRPATGKRKKIDPEVGEYIKFTETRITSARTDTASSTSAADDSTSVRTESQVTDIEWEDIK